MSKQVLFIQGAGAGAHDEWDNKLVESLARDLGPTYEISYPPCRTKPIQPMPLGRRRFSVKSRRSMMA